MDAVSGLPPKQRSAVVLRFATDMSYAGIGARLDCSEDAARRNVHEGLKKLRGEFAMNPMSEKKLEKLLRQAPSGGDLDRAVQGVIARAEREGLIDVAYATVDSPFGTLLVARTERGVVRLALPKHRGDQRSEDEVLEDLARFVSPRVLESPARLDEERRELDDYFEGKRDHFDVPVDWQLTRPASATGPARGRADPLRRDPELRRGRRSRPATRAPSARPAPPAAATRSR